ncbi:unnamed protein product [Lactuca virosa]|uniref:Uncharacterized protein n=1 Tax=Lactuca virosa TaxID=75947 RepID=A0AAU9NRR9_9ASTR|nr:unnamed protein product [Lactuca virosa]
MCSSHIISTDFPPNHFPPPLLSVYIGRLLRFVDFAFFFESQLLFLPYRDRDRRAQSTVSGGSLPCFASEVLTVDFR